MKNRWKSSRSVENKGKEVLIILREKRKVFHIEKKQDNYQQPCGRIADTFVENQNKEKGRLLIGDVCGDIANGV